MIKFRVLFSGVIIAGSIAAVAAPVSFATAADRPDAAPARCQTVNFTSFSQADQEAALNYWTPQRMATAQTTSKQGGVMSDLPAATTTVCIPVSSATSAPDEPAPGTKAGSVFFNGYPADGELFSGSHANCTGSVLNGNNNHISLVLTAAHCLLGQHDGQVTMTKGSVYVPQYYHGHYPYKTWDSVGFAWKGWIGCSHGKCSINDEDDYAILVLVKHQGLQVGRITGYNGWTIDFKTLESNVHLVGYPRYYTNGKPIPVSIQRPLTTVNTAIIEFPTPGRNLPYWTMPTPGFTTGTSGSPWLINFNNGVGIAIGDLGGYQAGGINASPSYSSSWDYSESNFMAVLSEADRIKN
jgi:hypothetical protein